MNTKTTLLLLVAALTFASPAARAQFPGGGFQGGSQVATAKPAWMSNRITLNVNNASLPQVLYALLDKAGVKTYALVLKDGLNDRMYAIADGKVAGATDASLAQPFGSTITVDYKNVTAELGLKKIAEMAGVHFSFETAHNGLTVYVTKTAAGYGTVYTISPKPPIDPAIADALTQAAKTVRDVQMFYAAPNALRLTSGATLPDTRVKLDVRGSDVRDILQTILKQAHLDYALEDDVPDTPKRSFTFENVPVGTALDVICQSADIGWRVETHGGKTLVRVGKKYAASANSLSGSAYSTFFAPPVVTPPKPGR